ncbi:MAG: hypothetical protein R3C49_09390 [Planctomycetaceae bacterium]
MTTKPTLPIIWIIQIQQQTRWVTQSLDRLDHATESGQGFRNCSVWQLISVENLATDSDST